MEHPPTFDEKKGLLFIEPTLADYKDDGAVHLGGAVIRPDGQWDAFLATPEEQDKYLQTMGCTGFNTLKAVQTLQKQEYGDITNWSDRLLNWLAGTTINGNDPNTLAETLRKKGTVYETDWPYTSDINTWAKFYATPPYDLEVQAQVKFRGAYDFGHQWVGTDPQSMMNALHFSPLGVDVYAWNMSDNYDIYHRNGGVSGHWTMIYGYEKGKWWKCLDSYPPFRKKLDWDFGFSMVKQYTLHKTVLTDSPWSRAIRYFQKIFGL